MNTDILIVSGYGFGDKGINSRLIRWLYNYGLKMIVIHPSKKGLLKYSRGAINNNWSRWESKNKVVVVKKKIENVLWSDIEGYLN